jgi:hypothetical protein
LPAHPATAPAAITVALALVVVGMGWLNRGDEPREERLAVPLASGAQASGGEGDDDDVVWPWASAEEGGRSLPDGRPFVTENWLDIPLVAPALVLQPGAVGTIIPGQAVAPGTATGTLGLVPSAGPRTPGSGAGAGSGPGSGDGSSGAGSATTVTTAPGGPTGTGDPTTTTPTTAGPGTSAPPTSAPTTTAPPGTSAPTTAPTTTAPPGTSPPTTAPPEGPPPSGGGLLDAVDDLLGGVVGGVGGVVDGLGGALGL